MGLREDTLIINFGKIETWKQTLFGTAWRVVVDALGYTFLVLREEEENGARVILFVKGEKEWVGLGLKLAWVSWFGILLRFGLK